jgi:hypothetical protein
MLGTHWLRQGIESGVATQDLMLRAARESESFLDLRARHLIYP